MERLFKSGLVTTIIGIIFIGVALYMYVTKSATQMETGEMVALGLIFLRSKDSLIGLDPNRKKK